MSGEHFPRNTVSAAAWCTKCSRFTQHRVDHSEKGGGRKGPCLECIARLDSQHKAAEHKSKPAAEPAQQQELFV